MSLIPSAIRHHPNFLFGFPIGVPDYLGADSEESPPEPLVIGVVKVTFAIPDRIGISFRDPDRLPPT
jgi:hypothetical protein